MSDGSPYPHFVYAKINEHIGPMERGKYYANPLHETLEKQGIGEISGGGTQPGKEPGSIDFAGLDIELADLESSLDLVRQKLIEFGVPYGSELAYTRDGIRLTEPIGTYERCLIYLDMVGLPEDVYAQSDFENTYVGLRQELQNVGAGEPHGAMECETELCLFVVGLDADSMYAVVKTLPAKMPVFQNARVQFIRRPDEIEIPESRLPFNS